MSALIELDEKRRRSLEQMARRRKVSMKRIIRKGNR
jgi:pheromone shutdown protein TraB